MDEEMDKCTFLPLLGDRNSGIQKGKIGYTIVIAQVVKQMTASAEVSDSKVHGPYSEVPRDAWVGSA